MLRELGKEFVYFCYLKEGKDNLNDRFLVGWWFSIRKVVRLGIICGW